MRNSIALTFAALIGGAPAHGATPADDEGGMKTAPGEQQGTGETKDGTKTVIVPTSNVEVDFTIKPGEGITIETKQKNFKLQIRNKVRLRWTVNAVDEAPNSDSFSIENPRTYFTGYLFDKNILYTLIVQYNESTATNSPLKEAWVDWWFLNPAQPTTIGFRLGQQKPRFGKIATNTSFGQEFVDRDINALTFSNTRARGAMLHGHHGGEKGKEMFHWNTGVWNSETSAGFPYQGEENSNIDKKPDFSLNAHIDPMGGMGEEPYLAGDLEHTKGVKMTIGGGVFFGRERIGNSLAGNEVHTITSNGYVALKTMGLHFLAEAFHRDDNPRIATTVPAHFQSWGYLGQGSYTFAPRHEDACQWGIALRYARVYVQDGYPAGLGYSIGRLGTAAGNLEEVTLGVNNYYHKHFLKTQVDASFLPANAKANVAADRDDWRFRLQFTIQV